MSNEYVHIVLNLFAVLALMLVLILIMKKINSAKYSANRDIKVINTVALGTKEKLVLVAIHNTTLLLGATANRIETLYVFNEETGIKEPIMNDKIDKLEKTNFKDHMDLV